MGLEGVHKDNVLLSLYLPFLLNKAYMFEFISVAHAAGEAVSEGSNAGGLAGSLGINAKLFFAQLINFAIVFFILWKLVFKNIIKTLNERQKKIEDSLKNAARVEETLARSETDYKQKMKEAELSARSLIKEAEEKALQTAAKIKEKTKEEINQTLIQAKEMINSERNEMIKEVKTVIADMVVATTEKILREKLTSVKDKQLIEKMI